ncbi:MAG: pyridoxamine 5'-phosphate oxidase family protein [Candidatus Methanomethylophilaceae archaeon]|nr:pyridoxamine 5'-phosphate oxidase family protein [Candidatus Methanomethylophilaceae archaeon]
MAKLTQQMADIFRNNKTIMLATASKDGVPNVAPMGMVILQDDLETIWIVDNYMNKTLCNLLDNPVCAISVVEPGTPPISFEFKGDVTIENSGADYEKAVAFAHSKSDKYPANNLLKIRIKEIYNETPGPGAGSKV